MHLRELRGFTNRKMKIHTETLESSEVNQLAKVMENKDKTIIERYVLASMMYERQLLKEKSLT